MPRANLDTTLAGAFASGAWSPVMLAQFVFKSQTVGCWSGPGTLTWGSDTFLGIGSLGKVSSFGGGDGTVAAPGTSVALSGCDTTILGEVLTDVGIGPNFGATLWLGAWANGGLYGTPYPIYVGGVDQPVIVPGLPTPEDPAGKNKFSIALRLETRLTQLARATCRRYTAADQRLYFPDDRAFNWVEILNDAAFLWG